MKQFATTCTCRKYGPDRRGAAAEVPISWRSDFEQIWLLLASGWKLITCRHATPVLVFRAVAVPPSRGPIEFVYREREMPGPMVQQSAGRHFWEYDSRAIAAPHHLSRHPPILDGEACFITRPGQPNVLLSRDTVPHKARTRLTMRQNAID